MSAEHQVWASWRALKRLFPTWTMPFDWVSSRGAWTMVGIDMVGGLRRNRSTEAAFKLMRELDDDRFNVLAGLAAVNARRQDRVFRTVVILYLTVPITILATWAEISSDSVNAYLRSDITGAVQYALLFTTGVTIYWLSWWRSKQMMDVIDLHRLERDARPFTALELRED